MELSSARFPKGTTVPGTVRGITEQESATRDQEKPPNGDMLSINSLSYYKAAQGWWVGLRIKGDECCSSQPRVVKVEKQRAASFR